MPEHSHSQGKTGRRDLFDLSAAAQQSGWMTGIADGDGPVFRGASADEGREVSGQHAFAKVPAVDAQVTARQQPAPDLRGKGEIVFEGALFVHAEATHAKPLERVGDEPGRFNGIVAAFAQTVGAGFEPLECRIDRGVTPSIEGRGRRPRWRSQLFHAVLI